MKKLIPFSLFLLSIFTTQNTLANMSPSFHFGAGGIISETWSLLQENISVEKHFLIFQPSNKNLYDKNAPYSWYDFLEKITGVSKNIIEKNSFYSREDFWFKLENLEYYKNLFWKITQEYSTTGSVNIIAQYHFKNNSEKKIINEKVSFSFWNTKYLAWGWPLYELYDENLKNVDHIYFLNDENNYPKNFKVIEKNKLLNSYDDYQIKDWGKWGYLETIDEIQYIWWQIPISFIDKVSTFSLSFKPYEEKIITISYSIPLKKDIYWNQRYIDYNYFPLTNWKNETIRESYIAVIGNKKNIPYDLRTSVNNTDEKSHINLKKLGKFIYWNVFKNVDKKNSLHTIQLAFANIDELNFFLKNWEWGRIEAINFFQSFFEKNNIQFDYENPPKATQSPDNPEKIIIEYNWEKFEMDFLEILK